MKTTTSHASPSWNDTRISSKLGIEYPLIQGPLGGLSSQKLTAIVSNFGGLGSFGAHGLTPSAIKELIAEIRSLTSKPFAVNLWVSMEDEAASNVDAKTFARALSHLHGHIESLGGERPAFTPPVPISFESQVKVLIDSQVPVFSFIFGIPPREILDECRTRGITTIGTATTVDEAIALEHAGVDVIAASGFEAGGHKGSFLRSAEASLTGTFSLVPQVADAVSVPVVAAGGVADSRGIVAAFALGAEGVQMGTAFLASEDSGTSAIHRKSIRSGMARRTALTKGFTGRLARGIQNQLLDGLNLPAVEILPYPLQRALVKNLTLLAERVERADLLPLWAGQSVSLSRESDAKALLRRLVAEVSTISGPVLDWSRGLKSAADVLHDSNQEVERSEQ